MAQTTRRINLPGEFDTEINTEVTPYPATISNSATTTVNMGCSPREQYFNYGFISCVVTLPTSGSALTVTIGKLDSTNAFAFVAFTAAQDITATSQTLKQNFYIPALTTLTDPQRRILVKDTLVAQFIAAGTVTGQATGAIVGAELYAIGGTAANLPYG